MICVGALKAHSELFSSPTDNPYTSSVNISHYE